MEINENKKKTKNNNRKILILWTLVIVFIICVIVSLTSERISVKKFESKESYLLEDAYPTIQLTEKEMILDKKIEKLRGSLLNEYGQELCQMNLLEGGALVSNKLYELCITMPKGGDLHAHSRAILDFDTFLNFTLEKGAYICLDEGKYYACIGREKDKSKVDMQEYILLKDALSDHKIDIDTLKHYWTNRDDRNIENPWKAFEMKRNYTGVFYNNNEMEYDYYVTGFEKYLSYGTSIIELRDSPTTDIVSKEDYQNYYKHLKVIEKAYYAVKEKHPELIVRIIISPSHRFPKKNADFIGHVLESSIKLYDEFIDKSMEGKEHFIIGFDVVGEEDDCFPLSEYRTLFEKTKFPEGFNLYLHCGESHKTDNDNIVDAYLFGAKRIGHGFNLFKYPKMLERYKEANIVVEICPISNLTLGYIKDLRSHPVVEYLKHGVNVVLCSDDAQYFENKTLVDDYYSAIICLDFGLDQLKTISKNAVLYSGLTGAVLDKAVKDWNKSWDEWISANVGDSD